MNKILILLSAMVFMAFAMPPVKKRTIFMAGDSTMAIKDVLKYPETGWGMPFAQFWDSSIEVVNLAKNGRSTQSFINEGLWNRIKTAAKPGDVVLIQFGHNDEVPTKKNATTPEQFKQNLITFINDTRAAGAIPIVFTPVARRKFDSTGNVEGTHPYSPLVKEVATLKNTPCIDMDILGQGLYATMGQEYSKYLLLHLKPGEHPNYPKGVEDNTHFSEFGARQVAQIALREILKVEPSLKNHLGIKP